MTAPMEDARGVVETRIVVLDDDPTGSQTVHGCLLLTRWEIDTLIEGLLDPSPLFFVLTNTRGMSAADAATTTRQVCENLNAALAELRERGRRINPLMVSRSDSTLRGHYPVETDVITGELGPFDATFLVPAFIEAGRITRESTHYVVQDGVEVPAHQTEFARDSVFGYRHSYLPAYVEERTRGRIQAGEVQRFVLDDVRAGVQSRLLGLADNACCAVDAVAQADLDAFARDLNDAAASGKRFLLRSAASILTSLAHLPPQPVPPVEMGAYARGARPGAVIVGSHVSKTTAQLRRLLEEDRTEGIELDVGQVDEDPQVLVEEITRVSAEAHERGATPVIFTSRQEKQFEDDEARLEFGRRVSSVLVAIVQRLPPSIGFLISKGGITSNDVLKHGLALNVSRLLGQIITGCSVVKCPDDHPRFPDLPVVIFPGNVGDADTLAEAYRRLARPTRTRQSENGPKGAAL